MNTTSLLGFENYNFMPAMTITYTPPLSKMDYSSAGYDHHGYKQPIVPTMSLQHMIVPSHPIEIYHQSNSSMPSSPKSAISTPPLSLLSVSLTEQINQRIVQLNKVPDSFLPEFHQYSKESYENGGGMKKRRCYHDDEEKQQKSAAELRRQIHIQSEQKRRAQIKDGFDILRQHLPGCGVNKKMSKSTLLNQTVQHLKYLKKNQNSILFELERLVQENEKLKQQRIY